MSRTLALLTLGALAALTADIARADVAPPKGFKRIALEHKITTEKEYPDYAFFVTRGGDKATAVTLDPKNPATIAAEGGRYRITSLVAVPKDAAKKYDSEKEFLAAVAKGKVEGLVRRKTNFNGFAEVKDTDTRTTMVREYTLEKIDAKEGIVLTVKKDGGGKNAPEEDSDEGVLSAYTPRGPWWVAGMIASLGVLLAGLWLVTRCRSHRLSREPDL